jgi:hypothetical protein
MFYMGVELALVLMEEHRLRGLQNRVIRKTFETKRKSEENEESCTRRSFVI